MKKFLLALVLTSLIIVNGAPISSSDESSSLEGTQFTGQMLGSTQGQLPGAFRGGFGGGFGRGFGGFGRGGLGGGLGFGLGLGLGSMLGGGGYGMYPGAFMNPYGYGGLYGGYGMGMMPGFYRASGEMGAATTPELSTSAQGQGDLSAPAQVPLNVPVASSSKKSTSGQFTSVLSPITNNAQTLDTINLPDIMKPYQVPSSFTTQENIKQPVIQPVHQPYLQRFVSQAQPIVQPIVNRVVQPVIHRQLKPFLSTQKIEGPAAYTTTLPAQYRSFSNQPIVGADLPSLAMPMASHSK